LQDTPKFTQIAIFGLKICHLASLVQSVILEGQADHTRSCTQVTNDSSSVLDAENANNKKWPLHPKTNNQRQLIFLYVLYCIFSLIRTLERHLCRFKCHC
jgi:hypothetical protein